MEMGKASLEKSPLFYVFLLFDRRSRLGKASSGGRNFLGRISVFHRGGGGKRAYRKIDFFRRLNQKGKLLKYVYDRSRTAIVGFVLYENGLLSYVVLCEGMALGDTFSSGSSPLLKAPGSSMPLRHIPLFTVLSHIEAKAYYGAQLARSAGVGALYVSRTGGEGTLKLSSGWQVTVSAESMASWGRSSHMAHKFSRIGKAGKQRALGFRPVVRGVAKNPCDHPHGGGEGKSSPPRAQVSPWGKLTKGTPTKNRQRDRLRRRRFKLVT